MKAASEMEPFTLTFVEILLPKLKRFGVSDEAIPYHTGGKSAPLLRGRLEQRHVDCVHSFQQFFG